MQLMCDHKKERKFQLIHNDFKLQKIKFENMPICVHVTNKLVIRQENFAGNYFVIFLPNYLLQLRPRMFLVQEVISTN
jgi:hypothetical protein